MTIKQFLKEVKKNDLKQTIREMFEEKQEIFFHKNETLKLKERYLSRSEVAKILKVSLPTLNEWTKQDYVESCRIGSRIRYKSNEIEE